MARVGRPTKYKRAYCQMVIDHMEQGFSFESFAGLIGTHKQTIYDWRNTHPEFSDSVKIAFEKCRVWWEKQGMEGLWSTKEGTFNSSNYIFQMKNRFRDEWKDKHETENTHRISGIDLKELVKFTDQDGGDK